MSNDDYNPKNLDAVIARLETLATQQNESLRQLAEMIASHERRINALENRMVYYLGVFVGISIALKFLLK